MVSKERKKKEENRFRKPSRGEMENTNRGRIVPPFPPLLLETTKTLAGETKNAGGNRNKSNKNTGYQIGCCQLSSAVLSRSFSQHTSLPPSLFLPSPFKTLYLAQKEHKKKKHKGRVPPPTNPIPRTDPTR